MNNCLSIVKVTADMVVLKNENKTTLDVAMHPWFPLDEEYYTITRGRQHILTCIRKDGTTYDFVWGGSIRTLISESTNNKKATIVKFLEQTKGIPLDLVFDTEETEWSIERHMYNGCTEYHVRAYEFEFGEKESEIVAVFRTQEEALEAIKRYRNEWEGDKRE